MGNFLDRRFEISIDDEIFIAQTTGRQFRFVFNILNDFGGFNSYADLALNNLSQDMMSKVRKGQKVSVKLGYKDSIDTVFSGEIRNTFREKPEASTLFRIIAHSNTSGNWVEKPLGVNTEITAIFKTLAKALELPLVVTEEDFSDVPKYVGGYTCSGDPLVILNGLAEAHDFKYIVDNGNLVIVRNGSFRKGQVAEISQFNGMEGIPKITEVGADVLVRMNPRLKIGGRFKIISDYKTFNFSNLYFNDVPENAGTGTYNIQKLEYSGDSFGDSWSVNVTGVL